MARCRTDLSVRSDSVTLSAWDGSAKHKAVLAADAAEATWRIVEAFSVDSLPFELILSWSAGAGAGVKAKITACRSVRVCVFARALQVTAANLADSSNRVSVTVADGFSVTHNQYEAIGEIPNSEGDVEIPPFALRFRFEISDPSYFATTEIRIYDGAGTLRSLFMADTQPDGGVPLGGAGRLTITNAPASSTPYRVVFELAL